MRSVAIVFSLLTLVPALVLAAPDADDAELGGNKALAHDLFDQGRALMAVGDYRRACRKFEESRKADASTGGGGTLLNLALCQERSGKTGTAWALFRTARSLAIRDRRDDRRVFAEEHIAHLLPRLVRLRVVVSPEARLPQLEVVRSGTALSPGEWNEALVVDPGEHTVEARAPGRLPFRASISVHGDGISRDLVVPVLPRVPIDGRSVDATDADPNRRTVAILVGGAGLAALAIGGIYGVRAIERRDQSNNLCPNYDRCNPAGILLSADAASDARVAVSTMIGGAIVLGIGAALYLTASPLKAPRRTTLSNPTALQVLF